MTTPESLQLNNLFHFRLEQLVVISVASNTIASRFIIETLRSIITEPKSLKLGRLAVHVEFGMFAFFAHAIGAIGSTISHSL